MLSRFDRQSGGRRRWSVVCLGLAVIALVASAGAGLAAEPDLLHPDLESPDLPSLVERWSCDCDPGAASVGAVLDGGAVFVQGYRRFFALDAETGELIWDHPLEEVGTPVGRPLVLDDRVVFAYRDRVVLVEPVRGEVIAALDDVFGGGFVEQMVGPPLTVTFVRRSEEPGRLEGGVVRIDQATGEVVARRGLHLLDLVSEEGRLLAVRAVEPLPSTADGSPPAVPDRLLELSVRDLSTVRSWPGADALIVRASPGSGPLVPSEATVEGVRYRAVRDLFDDPAAGSLSAPRLHRDFYDLDAELQAEVPLGPDEGSALRRLDPMTGEVAWTTPLPDPVGAWLWDDGRILVHTRPQEGGRGLLVAIDPETGAVLDAACGLASVRSLERWGNLVVVVTREKLVAIDAAELGPERAAPRPSDGSSEGDDAPCDG